MLFRGARPGATGAALPWHPSCRCDLSCPTCPSHSPLGSQEPRAWKGEAVHQGGWGRRPLRMGWDCRAAQGAGRRQRMSGLRTTFAPLLELRFPPVFPSLPLQVSSTVLELQRLLPRARFVYCSATGVSEVGAWRWLQGARCTACLTWPCCPGSMRRPRFAAVGRGRRGCRSGLWGTLLLPIPTSSE